MEWGTRTAIDTYRKLHNQVLDVVYDLGAVGKEPMVRLLAHGAGCGDCGGVGGGGVSCEEIILSPHFCDSFLFYNFIFIQYVKEVEARQAYGIATYRPSGVFSQIWE